MAGGSRDSWTPSPGLLVFSLDVLHIEKIQAFETEVHMERKAEKRLGALESLLSSIGARVVALEEESPHKAAGQNADGDAALRRRISELESVVQKQSFRIKFLRQGIEDRDDFIRKVRNGEKY